MLNIVMDLRFAEEEAVAWLTEQLLGSRGPRSMVGVNVIVACAEFRAM